MPAAVTYIGLQIGGNIGAALIMNSVAIATGLTYIATAFVSPAIAATVRRTAARKHVGASA